MNKVLALMLVLVLSAGGCKKSAKPGADPARPAENAAAAEEGENCEHGIPLISCDKCRFEAGAVKVDAGLEARLLKQVKAPSPAVLAGRLSLMCRVGLDESRTVDIKARAGGVLHGPAGKDADGLPPMAGSPAKAGQVLARIAGGELGALAREHDGAHRELGLVQARAQVTKTRADGLGQLLLELRKSELKPELLRKLAALPEAGLVKGEILEAATGLWKAREDHQRELARVAGMTSVSGKGGGDEGGWAGDWAGKMVQARAGLTLAKTRLDLTRALMEGGAASKAEEAAARAEQDTAKAEYEALKGEARLTADRLMVETEGALVAAEARFTAVTEEAGLELAAQKASMEGELGESEARLKAAHATLEYLGLGCKEAAEDGKALPPLVAPVTSPVDGTVVEWSAAAGSVVEAGAVLGRVSDLSSLWVWCEVHPADMALAAGLALPSGAEILLVDGRRLEGRLEAIAPVMEPERGVYLARIVVNNRDRALLPGMAVNAVVMKPDKVATVALPDSSLVEDEGSFFVFVKEQDLWIRRLVEVGARAGGVARISKGLKGGEIVASSGAFYLKSDILREKMGAGCAD